MKNNLILNDWLEYLESLKNSSPNTIASYKNDLSNFLQFISYRLGLTEVTSIDQIPSIDISKIDKEILASIGVREIISYISYCNVHLGNTTRTRSRKITALRGFFNYLHKVTNIIEENPMTYIDGPKISKRLPNYMGLEDVKLLLETILAEEDEFYKRRNFAVIMTFLNTGLRLSELVNLKLRDLDKKTIHIIGKGNKERIIYLNASNFEAIDKYLEIRPESDLDNLFLNKSGTRNFGQRGIQHMLKKYLKKSAIDSSISPHTLRHTAATLMYQYGQVDIRTLQVLLGHESLSTTQIYTHVDQKQVEEAIDSNPIGQLNLEVQNK